MVNDPLYNHVVFGPEKGKGGRIGKSDEKLIADLISIHNAENWLGLDEDGLGPVQPGSIIGQNIQLREPEGMIFLAYKVMSDDYWEGHQVCELRLPSVDKDLQFCAHVSVRM